MSNPSTPITIKKYANRRLYNTASSAYVTLADLAKMVKTGEDFVVYDAKTNEDITRSVLDADHFRAGGQRGPDPAADHLPAPADPLLRRQRAGAAAELSRILDRPVHRRAESDARGGEPRFRPGAVPGRFLHRAAGADAQESRRLHPGARHVRALLERAAAAARLAGEARRRAAPRRPPTSTNCARNCRRCAAGSTA